MVFQQGHFYLWECYLFIFVDSLSRCSWMSVPMLKLYFVQVFVVVNIFSPSTFGAISIIYLES